MKTCLRNWTAWLLRLFFCFTPVLGCGDISVKIEQLSTDEIEELKLLFHYLFSATEFGFTLLGNKPMSLCFPPVRSIHISTRDHLLKIHKNEDIDLYNALITFSKLKFKDNYTFITEKNKYGSPCSLFFINKEKFFRVFNENIDLFKRVYGQKISPESFITFLQTKDNFIVELFEQHALLGILLGYGRHNAELFERRHPLFGRRKIPYTIYPKPTSPFLNLEEELCFFKKKLQLVQPNRFGFLKISKVNFAADPASLETEKLCDHYALIHRELMHLFSYDNWFEILLEKLCESEGVYKVQ
jgi:hypothetical protein